MGADVGEIDERHGGGKWPLWPFSRLLMVIELSGRNGCRLIALCKKICTSVRKPLKIIGGARSSEAHPN